MGLAGLSGRASIIEEGLVKEVVDLSGAATPLISIRNDAAGTFQNLVPAEHTVCQCAPVALDTASQHLLSTLYGYLLCLSSSNICLHHCSSESLKDPWP